MAPSAPDQRETIRCLGCRAKIRVPADVDRSRLRCPRCKAPLVAGVEHGQRYGDYQVVGMLGRGAMGAVFLAEDRRSGERVALKVLGQQGADRRELVARFRREARLGALIEHPNVVACLGSGRHGREWYLAMELATGGDLGDHLRKHGPLSWQRCLAIFEQLADALATMAGLDVVHRDIKPGNIMLDAEGRPKLADFGLGKIVSLEGDEDDPVFAALTLTGTQLGSPAYMPPEQIDDALRVTPAADVYALMATMFTLLTGHRPFPGKVAVEVMHAVLTEPPPRLRSLDADIPPALDELVDWCLAKRPEDRPTDGRRLRELLAEVRERPQDTQAIRDQRRVRRSHSWIMIAVAAAVVVILAGVVLALVM